jgi:hypothetical protein
MEPKLSKLLDATSEFHTLRPEAANYLPLVKRERGARSNSAFEN